MSLLDAFGAGKTLEQVRAIIDEAENRLEGIISGNLDRLDGAKIIIPQIEIRIELPGEPKATPVE